MEKIKKGLNSKIVLFITVIMIFSCSDIAYPCSDKKCFLRISIGEQDTYTRINKVATEKIRDEISIRTKKLTGLFEGIFSNLNRNDITVHSLRQLLDEEKEKVIYGHIQEIRNGYILGTILSSDVLFFLRLMVWGHDSPDIALCQQLSECLYSALISCGFKEKEEVDYESLKLENGAFHMFVKLKGSNGKWIAIDFATSMFLHENIKQVVIEELENHKNRMNFALAFWNSDGPNNILEIKALPLRVIFSRVKENRELAEAVLDRGVSISALTDCLVLAVRSSI